MKNPPLLSVNASETPTSLHKNGRDNVNRLPDKQFSLKPIGWSAAIAIVYIWSFYGTEASPQDLATGIPDIARFIYKMFPPAFDLIWAPLQTPSFTLLVIPIPAIGFSSIQIPIPEVLLAIIETVQMAVVGTTLGVLLAQPFALLAARNTTPHASIYHVSRFLLNANRAIPDIIFGLLFVSAVGLGPFAGVLALAVGSVGSLGKVFAESIESIDPQQVLAVKATGTGNMLTFWYAVIPQSLPVMASYALLYFEHNVRSATILGIVGAGGVGLILNKYYGLFQYQKLLGAIIILVTAVTILDRFSDYLRKKII